MYVHQSRGCCSVFKNFSSRRRRSSDAASVEEPAAYWPALEITASACSSLPMSSSLTTSWAAADDALGADGVAAAEVLAAGAAAAAVVEGPGVAATRVGAADAVLAADSS